MCSCTTGRSGSWPVSCRAREDSSELNYMDPYDFFDNDYRCTVTIGRLTPNASWWFPSCSKCSKSCVPEGAGYRCNACSSTSFKFKYKISFVALDGTDEAEMVCFGDVKRRIIGKPVRQLLRSSSSPNTYPPEIARIVSLRFTFAIALTQQSYYRQQKTYQVVSMITAYDRRLRPGDAAQNDNAGHPDNSGGDQSSSQATSHGIEEASDTTLSSPFLTSTPPPVARLNDPPSVKSQARRDVAENDAHPSAKKRLTFEKENTTELLSKDSQPSDGQPEHPDLISTDMSQKSVFVLVQSFWLNGLASFCHPGETLATFDGVPPAMIVSYPGEIDPP